MQSNVNVYKSNTINYKYIDVCLSQNFKNKKSNLTVFNLPIHRYHHHCIHKCHQSNHHLHFLID